MASRSSRVRARGAPPVRKHPLPRLSQAQRAGTYQPDPPSETAARGLYRTGFLERGKRAVLFNGFETFHRDVDDDGFPKFRHIDAAAMKIRLPADLADGIKLRRASTVGVPPADLRALSGYVAGACHSRRMVA